MQQENVLSVGDGDGVDVDDLVKTLEPGVEARVGTFGDHTAEVRLSQVRTNKELLALLFDAPL